MTIYISSIHIQNSIVNNLLRICSDSRLANDPNLEKVAALDFLGPRFELINVPARVYESTGQKVGLLGCKPKSELARKCD